MVRPSAAEKRKAEDDVRNQAEAKRIGKTKNSNSTELNTGLSVFAHFFLCSFRSVV
jgi:hypothetical protein